MRLIRIRKARRIRKILLTFTRAGFGYLIDRLRIRKFKIGKVERAMIRKSQGERLRGAIEELGPVFIKFGQILSTRVDILPKEIILELSKLQDEVPALGFDKIKEVIEVELGSPIDKVFTKFSDVPIASASLAQVHEAELNGESVVVKVQRPYIRSLIEMDTQILKDVARIAERRIGEAQIYEPKFLVEEFERVIMRELNFIHEGMNIEKFRENFKDNPDICLPRVYWEYTTPRVLTLSKIEAIKITDFDGLEAAGISKKEVAERGARIMLKQIFEDGFFHGDPHPGNIFVTKDGRIALVDFGIVGRIDPGTQDILSSLFGAYINRNVDQIIEGLEELGIVKLEEKGEFKRDIFELLDRYYGIPIGKIEVKEASEEGFRVLRKYKVRLPRNLVLLAKSLGEIEGLGKEFDPEFSMASFALPWVQKLIARQYGIRWWLGLLKSYTRILKELPEVSFDILRKLSKGELSIKLEHPGVEASLRRVESAVNRIRTEAIIGGLMIVFAILIHGGFVIWGVIGVVVTLLAEIFVLRRRR